MLGLFTRLADASVYELLALPAGTPLAESLHFFVEDTTKIFFLLTFLLFLSGLLRSWVSPEKVRRWLDGKPRLLAYGLAVCLGVVTPFCSCSSIPLFIAFLSSGIPFGVTMAFLITSPMVNEVAALLFWETIGWAFMLSYIVTGMSVGFLGGILIDGLKLEKWVEPFVFQISFSEAGGDGIETPTFRKRVLSAWKETRDVLLRVWLYVLIGVGLGALIHGYLPQDWFLKNAGAENPFAVPLAVLAAIPLYASVTGTVPIAQALIAKGLPVGTTLAFIMSAVAISLPELLILRKVLRPQMLAFFVLYLIVAFLLVGYGFNWAFGVRA